MSCFYDFKKQIEEDIAEYQEKYGESIENINKPAWAFNFWILDKFFYVDESEIQNYIVDYNDKGIDCYYFYEDTKELYLLQNKYYSDKGSSKLTATYLNDDVFSQSIHLLRQGTYTRSKELQQIYNANANNPKFKIYIEIYVTNNDKDSSVNDAVQNFNDMYGPKIEAKVYYLDDIYNKFYDESVDTHQIFNYELKRINKNTTLKVEASTLNLKSKIDSLYMVLSVIDIYEMMKAANNANYNLVKDNIRGFLGPTSFNEDIAETLNSSEDRSNFLYYNNGITIICDKFSSMKFLNTGKYKLINPQIVNGCQTVNTIFDVLNMVGDEDEIRNKFYNCFVMAKILIIDDEKKKTLYKNIVIYNNSQNKIDIKDFEAIQPKYLRLQNQYKKRGFLLCVRPSDKYQFSREFQQPTNLIISAKSLLEKFGLNYTKRNQFIIKLDKFLQVILAFVGTSCDAVQKKSSLLKTESNIYKSVCDFIFNNSMNNDLLLLYLLYARFEQEKKGNPDERFPNSFMAIDGFSKYECKHGEISISDALSTKEKINEIVDVYTAVTKKYYDYFIKNHENKEYNDMNKALIEYDEFEKIYRQVKEKNKKDA